MKCEDMGGCFLGISFPRQFLGRLKKVEDRLVKMELERPRGSRLGGKAKMMGWGGVQDLYFVSYLISYLIFFVDGGTGLRLW